MNSITRSLATLSILTVSHALAAQSAPPASYSMSFVSDSAGHRTTMHIGEEILGAKLRMSTSVDNSVAGPLAMYMIIDSVAGTVTNVIPAQSIVSVMGSAMLKDPAMQPYTMELSGEPKIEAVDLGPGDAILGHATRHYRQTFEYNTKFILGDVTCSRARREITELWATTDISAANLTPTASTQWISLPRGYAQQLEALRKSAIKGVVLRQVGTTSTAGDTSVVHFTWEVTEIKQGPVDPADFDIPQGYTVMDTRESMAGIDPAVMHSAMAAGLAKARERMRQTLCGGTEIRSP